MLDQASAAAICGWGCDSGLRRLTLCAHHVEHHKGPGSPESVRRNDVLRLQVCSTQL